MFLYTLKIIQLRKFASMYYTHLVAVNINNCYYYFCEPYKIDNQKFVEINNVSPNSFTYLFQHI